MTETAGEVINDILLDLVVLGSDATMDPSETASTIRYINRYMTMQDAMGLSLGFTKITSVSDPITIPDGAIMGLIKNVVLIMAPQFGAVISPVAIKAANDGLEAMENLGISVLESSMPCTLPIGSGNEWNGYNTQRFFPCGDDPILTENGQNIQLEDDTDGN